MKFMILHFKNTAKLSKSSKKEMINIIISELKSREVDFLEVNESAVFFKNNFWSMKSFFQTISNADKGVFKLREDGNSVELIYESSISFVFELILIMIFSILSIFFKTFFVIGVILLLFQTLMMVKAVKLGNEALMEKASKHNKRM
jgi:hypothetical protein